jgi:hypothetical protein
LLSRTRGVLPTRSVMLSAIAVIKGLLSAYYTLRQVGPVYNLH